MIANRVPRKIGGIVLSHLLNSKGTIEAEVVVTRLGTEQFYVTFAAFFEQRVLDWFAAHRGTAEQVEIRSVSEDHGCLSLAGPKARDVLRRITRSPLDNASFPWLSQRDIDVAGKTVRALRISYAGELGWEFHAPMASMPEVYDAIMTAGQDFGIENYGSFALNSMRLEKAFHASSELTNEVTLTEADVMRFLNLDKGVFIGREATLESMKNPLKWKCVSLEVVADDADCWGGETIYWNGGVVGFVSSGGYGHRVKKSLAFAYVDSACSDVGTALHVEILGERRPAVILDGPAYDPSNDRPRADG
jgi:dimethylglycine dehydrogenase